MLFTGRVAKNLAAEGGILDNCGISLAVVFFREMDGVLVI